MMGKPLFSRSGRAYIWGVIVAGWCIVGSALFVVIAGEVSPQWLVLAALTAISSSASVALVVVPASISVSDTFVFASLLLFGPAAGALTVAIDGLISSCWKPGIRRELHRVLFNVSAPTVSVWCAAWAFYEVAGLPASGAGHASIPTLLVPLLVCALTYFLLNTGLIAAAVACETKQPVVHVWRRNFAWLSLTYLAAASLALFLFAYTRSITFGNVALVLPVLGVLYFAFRTAMGRMGDANQHLGQLNRLYLSTIEALAMAIDAKDQVTHGHIRRVQLRAVALAGKIGVKDEGQIRAIEAAALLHDTGKIAIPEHILNKPGKLTAAEFETMKSHARIGADILSSIDFPFPVVPIVRHHHENWDGTGYPDGVSGVDIPIGARVLSVVDCFDALTSDRPYRRAMSDDEAIAILQERRGTMYDPFVVDTFVSAHREIVSQGSEPDEHDPAPEPGGPSADLIASAIAATAASAIGGGVAGPPCAADVSAAACALGDLANHDAGSLHARERGELLLAQIARLTPADLAVLFLYDQAQDAVVAWATRGWHERSVAGLTLPLGDRLSGWVASTRRAVVNSDPALDLCDTPAACAFQSTLSVPLVSGGELSGVMTLYATVAEAFSTHDRRAIESLAASIVDVVRRMHAGEHGPDTCPFPATRAHHPQAA